MEILLILPVILIAVVVHEVAHAVVALREGDPTAAREGRITLNPLPHLDLWGSIIVPIGLYLSGGFLFAWAKPVPVNPANFRDPKWSDVRVSLAGIVSNLVLACICVVLMIFVLQFDLSEGAASRAGSIVLRVLNFGILINLILAVFNLIPIPPLDGSHVMYHLLPPSLAEPYREFGKFGLIAIFLALILAPNVFGVIFEPVYFLMDLADRFIGLWV